MKKISYVSNHRANKVIVWQTFQLLLPRDNVLQSYFIISNTEGLECTLVARVLQSPGFISQHGINQA